MITTLNIDGFTNSDKKALFSNPKVISSAVSATTMSEIRENIFN
ncbi:hypothetical protein [Sphingobacterium sp. E70]|nr:hypothetical protein [Sphingobacterium sp. E70]